LASSFGYIYNQKRGDLGAFNGVGWVPVSTAAGVLYATAPGVLPAYSASPSLTNLSISGWERVGSLVVPTNTTAGDLTAARIWVPDHAGTFPTANGLINGYVSATATSPFVARMDSATTDPAFFAQGAAVVPSFAGVRSAGTIASPTAVVLNNTLVGLDAWGFYSATQVSRQAGLRFLAAENWSATNMGVTAVLNLTAVGGTAIVTNHVWTPAAYTVTGYVDASVGYRQGTMTAGRVLRSDGTNFISAQLGFSDLSGSIATSQIPDRTRYLPFIKASDFVSGGVGAPVHGSAGADGAGIITDVWSLPTAADSGIIANVYLPADWNGGSITVQVVWSPSNTNTNTCVLIMDATTYSVGDLITKAIVNSVSNTIMPSGTALAYQTPPAYAFTPATALFKLLLYRFTASASDTFTGDMQIWGVLISYTADS
jgi:hypothetical protein